jgi:3-phenylpropionate/cinnamic acid dioxygenase small subunit
MISTEDWHHINDVIARYCWCVDEADGDGWASLFTDDGQMNGMGLNLKGREQLKGMAEGMRGGAMRHLYSNLVCEYAGGGKDEVKANYYSYVANYAQTGVNVVGMALCRATLVRQGGAWKIRRNDIDLVGPTAG